MGAFLMSKSKIRHLFDGTRHSLDGAIFSQNAIKPGFFARQDRIGGKTYEVLTTFYAKQTQFPKSQNGCKLTLNKGL